MKINTKVNANKEETYPIGYMQEQLIKLDSLSSKNDALISKIITVKNMTLASYIRMDNMVIK